MEIKKSTQENTNTKIPPESWWWRHLLAGGISGAVSRTCTAPMDRVKVFMQVQPKKQSILDCYKSLFHEGGLRSFWRGNGMNVMKVVPKAAIKFLAYEKVKRLMIDDGKSQKLGVVERLFAGVLAGSISQIAVYPLDVLKTRLVLSRTGQYSSAMNAAYKIWKTEGGKSFYRGLLLNILEIVPFSGVGLALYDIVRKQYLKKYPDKERPELSVLVGFGCFSSVIGQMTFYPLMLFKTKLQAGAQSGATMNMSMAELFKQTIRNQGVRGLYRGISPTLMKTVPTVAITFVAYEYSSQLLHINMT